MPAVVVAVPVAPGRQVAHSWGRAPLIALVTVTDGQVSDWAEHAVGWDELHDTGTEGSHHARVVRFLRENGVQAVAAQHMGPPMQNTLAKLGIAVSLTTTEDATAAALAVAGTV